MKDFLNLMIHTINSKIIKKPNFNAMMNNLLTKINRSIIQQENRYLKLIQTNQKIIK